MIDWIKPFSNKAVESDLTTLNMPSLNLSSEKGKAQLFRIIGKVEI